MADVQPFRGLRYARDKVGDLAQIITPPFDVINKEAQTRYYERHPYNVIRMELGRQEPTDDTLNNVYTSSCRNSFRMAFTKYLIPGSAPLLLSLSAALYLWRPNFYTHKFASPRPPRTLECTRYITT